MSGCVYHGGDDLSDITAEAYKRFSLSNPLHPDVFPSVRKVRCLPVNAGTIALAIRCVRVQMESEVVSMTVKLFNGGAGSCGTMTSGGTESILLAVKAYRVS
jgi:sphinganine-1-phosphate aldolase